MAKLKPEESDKVKLERIRSEIEQLRIIEGNKTRRHLGLGALATITTGILASAVVRMTEKPPWLVFGLAVVSAVGGQVIFSVGTARRMNRASERRPRGRRDDGMGQP